MPIRGRCLTAFQISYVVADFFGLVLSIAEGRVQISNKESEPICFINSANVFVTDCGGLEENGPQKGVALMGGMA